jgi:hypothetical protein
LAARQSVTVVGEGRVDVRGQPALLGFNAGGGSGGAIMIEAPTITTTPRQLDVAGASGSDDGGDGGEGRIRLLSNNPDALRDALADDGACVSTLSWGLLRDATPAPPPYELRTLGVLDNASADAVECGDDLCQRSERRMGQRISFDESTVFGVALGDNAVATGIVDDDSFPISTLTFDGDGVDVVHRGVDFAIASASQLAIGVPNEEPRARLSFVANRLVLVRTETNDPAQVYGDAELVARGSDGALVLARSPAVLPLVVGDDIGGEGVVASAIASDGGPLLATIEARRPQLLTLEGGLAVRVAGGNVDIGDSALQLAVDSTPINGILIGRVVVGDDGDNACVFQSGQVTVFQLFNQNGVSLIRKHILSSQDPRVQGRFGRRVAVRGRVVAVASVDSVELFDVRGEDAVPLGLYRLPAGFEADDIGLHQGRVYVGWHEPGSDQGGVTSFAIPQVQSGVGP